ncbi:hypothetical protein [Nocardia salmonicida]|uniref:hypothetical protein n=1 Tax=Nocardia salmonicida TaxID=53431 RepID=UPI003F53E755
MDRSELADFLRRHRDLLTPADVGLPPGVRRRTPGLRRDEVALLTGERCSLHTPQTRGRERDNNVAAPICGSVFDHIATTESVGAS